MWTTKLDVRRLNGLPVDTEDPNFVRDSELDYYIERAQYAILPDISILIKDDELFGSIDGSNVKFYTTHSPLFDANFDGTINASDVIVYSWKNGSKNILSVSSVDPEIGLITLNDAPSDIDKVTSDYRYSKYKVDWNLLSMATAYFTGFLYFTSQYMEIPNRIRVGVQSYIYDSSPAQKAWNSYLSIMDRIRSRVIFAGSKE